MKFKAFLLLLLLNFELNSEFNFKKTVIATSLIGFIGALGANYHYGKKTLDYFEKKNLMKQEYYKKLQSLKMNL